MKTEIFLDWIALIAYVAIGMDEKLEEIYDSLIGLVLKYRDTFHAVNHDNSFKAYYDNNPINKNVVIVCEFLIYEYCNKSNDNFEKDVEDITFDFRRYINKAYETRINRAEAGNDKI